MSSSIHFASLDPDLLDEPVKCLECGAYIDIEYQQEHVAFHRVVAQMVKLHGMKCEFCKKLRGTED